MGQIQFSCFGCLATLAVRAELAGKVVACGKCKQRSTVPAPAEPVAPPPPPPPAPPPRKVIRAAVDEDEGESATYGLEGKPKRDAARAKPVPIAQWWPDGAKLNAPATWTGDLARAKRYAELGEWKDSLTSLHNLYKRGRVHGIADAHVLNRPLAYCLSRWAMDELDRIACGEGLSKPLAKLLKQAREQQKWGGFRSETCPLCSRTLPTTIGTIQIRTVAGSAYVCCASPTVGDDALIRRVHKVSQKLTLATGLSPDTPEVGEATAQLPKWYRAVDLSASWWVRAVTEGDSGGGGSLLGNVLGNTLGEALGELLGG
jgi:hypothetical protein